MKKLNIFYFIVILVGLLLWWLNANLQKETVRFFGFAENKDTEINFNYSTAVGKIYVTPGQFVKKGEPLLDLYRIKSKEVLEDQGFKIEELKSKKRIQQTEKGGNLKILEAQKALKMEELDAAIEKIEAQKKFQASLYEDLQSVEAPKPNYQPLTSKIAALQKEKDLLEASFNQKIELAKQEFRLSGSPYEVEIKRLEAERVFDETNKVTETQLTAPSDGVIGNIHCKEGEHIPSFKTLVTFYEPNPTLVSGFVHEDLILHVNLKDSFLIRSTKDPSVFCYGEVTGLGSRIVEIPDRLRKIPDLKTYGREVLVQIPSKNNFLQKEKVILEFVHLPEGLTDPKRRKPLVDLKLED